MIAPLKKSSIKPGLTEIIFNEIERISSEPEDYLKELKQDSKLQLRDFTPTFGKYRYDDRTSKYKFSSLFEPFRSMSEETWKKVEENKKILNSYDLLMTAIISTTIVYTLFNYFSK